MTTKKRELVNDIELRSVPAKTRFSEENIFVVGGGNEKHAGFWSQGRGRSNRDVKLIIVRKDEEVMQ